MAKITFLRVLKNNLKCAICKEKECSVRYYPERKRFQYYDGTRYVIECQKDYQKRIEKALKTPLPWVVSLQSVSPFTDDTLCFYF